MAEPRAPRAHPTRPELALTPEMPAWATCPECHGEVLERAGGMCVTCQGRGEVPGPFNCPSCGTPVDPQLDAAYSCAELPAWHCWDCHAGHGPEKEVTE